MMHKYIHACIYNVYLYELKKSTRMHNIIIKILETLGNLHDRVITYSSVCIYVFVRSYINRRASK